MARVDDVASTICPALAGDTVGHVRLCVDRPRLALARLRPLDVEHHDCVHDILCALGAVAVALRAGHSAARLPVHVQASHQAGTDCLLYKCVPEYLDSPAASSSLGWPCVS